MFYMLYIYIYTYVYTRVTHAYYTYICLSLSLYIYIYIYIVFRPTVCPLWLWGEGRVPLSVIAIRITSISTNSY